MPEINGQSIMMAVQAVDQTIQSLIAQIATAHEDDATDLEDELQSYMSTATDLRIGYEAALKLSSNLPPYATLVRPWKKP